MVHHLVADFVVAARGGSAPGVRPGWRRGAARSSRSRRGVVFDAIGRGECDALGDFGAQLIGPFGSVRPSACTMSSMAASAAALMAARTRCCSSCRLQFDPTLSLRIKAGSVRPCPTRVTAMTKKVRKMIRSRCGKGVPFGQRRRQRQGRRQRDDAAHAAPADDAQFAFPEARFAFAQAAGKPARQVGDRIDPGEAHGDGDGADDQAQAGQLGGGVASSACRSRPTSAGRSA